MGVTSARFTLEHYEHMVATGAFTGKHRRRVELLNGRILEMTPIGPLHAYLLDKLARWSHLAVGDENILVRVQNPVRFPGSESEPEPDLAWVKMKNYARQHPAPEDVVLIVEIAETLLDYDRDEKLAAYAGAGIPEYWIINLIDSQIEVYREPVGNEFRLQTIHQDRDDACPLVMPTACLIPDDLFSDG